LNLCNILFLSFLLFIIIDDKFISKCVEHRTDSIDGKKLYICMERCMLETTIVGMQLYDSLVKGVKNMIVEIINN